MSDEEEPDWGSALPLVPALMAVAVAGGGGGEIMSLPRVIVHIDIDCFYAQVEMVQDPGLRDRPLGVQQKNIVVTTNYVARRRGVPKSGNVREILQAFPDLVLVKGEDLHEYRRFSQRIFELIAACDFAGAVERLGMDENFVDVTQWVHERVRAGIRPPDAPPGHVFGDEPWAPNQLEHQCLAWGASLALTIRTRLESQVGLTASAGVATNKTLAKLVGTCHKPHDQTVLLPSHTEALLATLKSPRSIPGIGSSTYASLQDLGIQTVAHLRAATALDLSAAFEPETAERLINLARGVDPAPVKRSGKAQSLGLEDRFKIIATRDASRAKLGWLWRRLAVLIHEDGRLPQVVRITARDMVKEKESGQRWLKESRQTKVSAKLFVGLKADSELSPEAEEKLTQIGMSLLEKMVRFDGSRTPHLTLLGICVSEFSNSTTASMRDFLKAPSLGTLTLKRKVSEPSEDIDEAVFSQLPPDIQRELRPSLQPKRSKSVTSHSTGSEAQPRSDRSSKPLGHPEWDPEVFAHLPSDIQKELLQGSNSRTSSSSASKPQAKKSIASYFKKIG